MIANQIKSLSTKAHPTSIQATKNALLSFYELMQQLKLTTVCQLPISHQFSRGEQKTTFLFHSKLGGEMLITLREFSTAPRVFNIEIQCPPQLQPIVEQAFAQLRKQFDKSQSYKVHRLECRLRQRCSTVSSKT